MTIILSSQTWLQIWLPEFKQVLHTRTDPFTHDLLYVVEFCRTMTCLPTSKATYFIFKLADKISVRDQFKSGIMFMFKLVDKISVRDQCNSGTMWTLFLDLGINVYCKIMILHVQSYFHAMHVKMARTVIMWNNMVFTSAFLLRISQLIWDNPKQKPCFIYASDFWKICRMIRPLCKLWTRSYAVG